MPRLQLQFLESVGRENWVYFAEAGSNEIADQYRLTSSSGSSLSVSYHFEIEMAVNRKFCCTASSIPLGVLPGPFGPPQMTIRVVVES